MSSDAFWELNEAIKLGDIATASAIVKTCNKKIVRGLLSEFIADRRCKAVKRLLEAGADPHFDKGQPLSWAAQCEDLATVEILLEHSKWSVTELSAALVFAGIGGSVPLIERLLAAGANIKKAGPDAIDNAARMGSEAAIDCLLARGALPHASRRRSTVAKACSYPTIAEKLVAAGAPASTHDELALSCAIGNVDYPMIKWLVSHGARPVQAAETLYDDQKHVVAMTYSKTRADRDVDMAFAAACMLAGIWSVDDVVRGCTNAEKIAHAVRHHPEGVSIIEKLPRRRQAMAMAMDAMVEL